jgi:hypothetical protein
MTVLTFTLEQYQVNEMIKPEEVYQMLIPEELDSFKGSFQKSLVKSFNSRSNMEAFKE